MVALVRKLAISLGAAAACAAIVSVPVANANPLLPDCEVTGGSSVAGGQTTECATEGNVQIDSTPPVYGMYPWDDDYFVL